ncbi:hypothetical protein R1flu_023809 [Riccia fluitans]|uniref:Uncharacterized protein n=1 Tax=Riccia fluitans TaxID=41844 RepID=A0ABD1XT88_9MARC
MIGISIDATSLLASESRLQLQLTPVVSLNTNPFYGIGSVPTSGATVKGMASMTRIETDARAKHYGGEARSAVLAHLTFLHARKLMLDTAMEVFANPKARTLREHGDAYGSS